MHHVKRVIWVLLYRLTAAGCRLRQPWLTALAWRLSLIRVPSVRTPQVVEARVLVLDKIGGTDDLAAAYRNTDPPFEFFLLRRKLVNIVFRHFLGDRVQHYGYVSSDEHVEAAKRAYREFLKVVLVRLHRSWTFDAAISFNVSYATERELAAAMSDIGLPFIVCHKECVKTEAKHRVFTVMYRERVGRFAGASISVYNEAERSSMLEAGLALPEQISVVGSPRVDLAHDMRRVPVPHESRRTILYYTIFEQAGLPYADKAWVEGGQEWYNGPPITWRDLARQTSEALLQLALEHPDVSVIIKAKQGNEAASRALLPGSLPPNLTFVAGGIGHTLLSRAAVVVAFNSASLLESIAAGRPVVLPLFGVEAIPHFEKFTYHIDGAVTVARTPEELKAALRRLLGDAARSEELTDQARQALERYVGNSDGLAGERYRRYLETVIRGRRPAYGPLQTSSAA